MALAGDGRELIAVGDPDQSIYAFRGADVRALIEFPDRFRTAADGSRRRSLALRTCRRSGRDLLAASRRVARRLPAAPVRAPPRPPPAAGAHAGQPARRDPHPGRGQLHPGGRAGRRHAAPRPPGRRRALAEHGRPGALGDPAGPAAAPGADRGRSPGRGRRGRAAAGRGTRHPAAADAAALRAEPDAPRRRHRGRAPLRPPGRHRRPRPAPPAPVPPAPRRCRPRGPSAPRVLLADALRNPKRPGRGAGPVAAPAERLARLLATARDAIKTGGSCRGRALGRLGRLRPGRAVAAPQRGRRPGGRGRRPGSGRGAGPVRQGRALHRQHAARRAGPVRRQPVQPGDRRRHPGRAGRP